MLFERSRITVGSIAAIWPFVLARSSTFTSRIWPPTCVAEEPSSARGCSIVRVRVKLFGKPQLLVVEEEERLVAAVVQPRDHDRAALTRRRTD